MTAREMIHALLTCPNLDVEVAIDVYVDDDIVILDASITGFFGSSGGRAGFQADGKRFGGAS